MSRVLFLFVLFTACALNRTTSHAADAHSPLEIVRVSWGLQGRFKLGAWTPLSVELRTGAQPAVGVLRVAVLDPDEMFVDYLTDPEEIEVQANETRKVVRYVRFGKQHARVQVEFTGQDGIPVVWKDPNERPPRGARTSQPTIGVIGTDPGFRQQIRLSDRITTEALELFAMDPSQHPLPEHWLGYDSVDLLVISTASIDAGAISTEAVAAIDQWVQQGGRLLWYGTSSVARLIEHDPSWQRLIPGTWKGVSSLPRLSSLEGHFGGKGAILAPASGIPFGVLEQPQGIVVLAEGEGRRQAPLWVRTPHGLGQVTFLTIDVDQAPLLAWPGLPDLIRRFIDDDLGKDSVGDSRVRHGQASHWGFRDLAGQLRSALDQFPHVAVVPVLLIGTLALAYIGLVGPFDYLLVTRWLRQTNWTWLTFPAVIAAFCVFTVWINQRWKGTRWVTNEAHVVDLDAASGVARGLSCLSIFGPRSGLVSVGLEPPAELPGAEHMDQVVSWYGLPGDGFGGVDQAAKALTTTDRYRCLLLQPSVVGRPVVRTRLIDFPFHANSSHAFVGQWSARCPMQSMGTLSADFDNLLSGSIVNAWGVPLEGTWICHGRWAYPVPGSWAPGQQVDLQALSSPRDVQALLTQRRFVTASEKEARDIATPWDRSSTNTQDIIRMMLLHDAAGGRSYTGLIHHQNARWDLSGHLGVGRAIVLGWTDKPGVHWNTSGAAEGARHEPPTAFYRIVLPVKLAEKSEVRLMRSE